MDEGLATSLLTLFSRERLVEPCEELVYTHLPRILAGSLAKEWHLAPLVAVYMSLGRIRDAIKVFDRIQYAVSVPSSSSNGSTEPSYRTFLEGLKTADQTTRALLAIEELLDGKKSAQREQLKEIPIQLVNAVLAACNQHSLSSEVLQLSNAVFKPKPDTPLILPDIETFNILLASCLPPPPTPPPASPTELFHLLPPLPAAEIGFSDLQAAEGLLETLKTDFRHLTPNEATYETIIDVYLRAEGDAWDLAFYYLEEMKHFDIMPSPFVYIEFMERQLNELDILRGRLDESEGEEARSILAMQAKQDHRIDLTLQEMAALGYLGVESGSGVSAQVLNRTMRHRIGDIRIRNIRQAAYRR